MTIEGPALFWNSTQFREQGKRRRIAMVGTRMLMLMCFTACMTCALSAKPRPAYQAVPAPVFDYRQLQSGVEAPGLVLDSQKIVVVPTPTVTVTQTALRSVTVIKTSVITLVETTIINAMTSTTIYTTIPVTVRPAPSVTTVTLPCSTSAVPEPPPPVADRAQDTQDAVKEDLAADPSKDTQYPVKEDLAADLSSQEVTRLQINMVELMNTFNALLTQIEMTMEREALVNRTRVLAKKVVMLRSTALKEEFVRKLKVVVGQAALLKANPSVFFDSVEELVENFEGSHLL